MAPFTDPTLSWHADRAVCLLQGNNPIERVGGGGIGVDELRTRQLPGYVLEGRRLDATGGAFHPILLGARCAPTPRRMIMKLRVSSFLET